MYKILKNEKFFTEKFSELLPCKTRKVNSYVQPHEWTQLQGRSSGINANIYNLCARLDVAVNSTFRPFYPKGGNQK